jgi:Uma2 family endonuclease
MFPAASTSRSPRSVRLVLDVTAREDEWVLSEENMPEATQHRDATDLLKLLLLAFAQRTRGAALVAANLACRWDRDNPAIGVDPDIAFIEPAPPGADALRSLRTWEPGHVPPRLAVEIVSATNPSKDYVAAPAKYTALGARELVVFDPERLGPAVMDGPHVLQVWRRQDDSVTMVRVYAGDGPAYSAELDAWWIPTPGGKLRIADDEHGRSLWLTEAEAEAEGRRREAEGRRREAEGRRREAEGRVEDICDLCGIPLDDARRAHIASLDAAGLDRLRTQLKSGRAWPE